MSDLYVDPAGDRPLDQRHGAPDAALARRRLLTLGGAAAAGVAGALTLQGRADAAPATAAWLCGGNNNINTNGTNFIGPTNAATPAPLIFKTTPSGGTPTERMRILATGPVGVGLNAPKAQLDVKSSSSTFPTLKGENTSSQPGVQGVSASSYGVQGTSATGSGVIGQGTSAGVVGLGGTYGASVSGTSYGTYSTGGPTGVYGNGTSYGGYFSGSSYGVYGYSSGSYGVYGQSATGVYGYSYSGSGQGVKGEGGQYAVLGVGGGSAGVRGDSNYVGVWGQGPSYGVYGYANGNGGYGVMGQSGGSAPWALYSLGNCGIQGTLTKNAGSFKIDHPLDPERKWLYHSFVESPDMMNVYNGNVTLDERGRATVTMPDWFEALNREFRYQLTSLGGAQPKLHVKKEMRDGRFTIAGGKPGGRVSWQVTGIRQDDYAKAHPIPVEADKTGKERGTRIFVPKGSKAKAYHPSVAPRAAASEASDGPGATREPLRIEGLPDRLQPGHVPAP